MMIRTLTLGVGLGVGALLLAGCAGPAEPQQPATPPAAVQKPGPTPAVSVNAMMVALVDHAGHVLWDAEREGQAPKTDKQWQELEHHAIQLAASGTLIGLGGTGPADPGWAQLPAWKTYSQQLTDAALADLAAARAKNLDALVKANGQLVDSCENCHKEFKPALPTEGITHPH